MVGLRTAQNFLAIMVLGLVVSTAQAENEGQADLDKATELKFSVKSLGDLSKVIELSEIALEKGLDKDGSEFAIDLLTSSLYQRAIVLTQPIFQQRAGNKWKELRSEALKDLTKILKHNEDFGEAHLLLTRLEALPEGDKDRAKKSVSRAIELLAGDKKQLSLAMILRGTLNEDTKQREADFNKAVELDATNMNARRLRGMFYLTQGKYEKSLADFEEVLKKKPDNINVLRASVAALSELKRFDEALKHLNMIVKNEKGTGIGFMLRSQWHLSQGNLDRALADVSEAIERQPGARNAILLRSVVHAARKDYAAAAAEIEGLVRQLPNSLQLVTQLAAYYSADGRPRKAIAAYDAFIEKHPIEKHPEVRVAIQSRGNMHLNIGEHAKAIADYETAFKHAADDPNLLNNLAWVLATSTVDDVRDGKRAVEIALKAAELTDNKTAHVLSTLAAAYAETGDFASAVKWSNKAIELKQQDAAEDDGRDIAAQLSKELESYEKKKPWRERKTVEEKKGPASPDESDLDFE